MKTITQIKKEVLASGGEFYKEKRMTLNGSDAYRVNGKLLTKPQVIEADRHGAL